MATLLQQRCLHHDEREAVARCPGCERFFCRECVTEHEDRVICSSCLEALVRAARRGRRRRRAWFAWAPPLLGLLAAWWFFYLLGRFLLSLDPEFHDGSAWIP